jgi:hypothetical protein
MAARDPIVPAPETGIADAIDDVVQSAREVAMQGAALARLEAGEAVARGLQAGALVLCAAIFAGFVAAALWIAAIGGAAWWVGERFGPAAGVGLVAGVHALAALGAWAAWRRARGDGPDESAPHEKGPR